MVEARGGEVGRSCRGGKACVKEEEERSGKDHSPLRRHFSSRKKAKSSGWKMSGASSGPMPSWCLRDEESRRRECETADDRRTCESRSGGEEAEERREEVED